MARYKPYNYGQTKMLPVSYDRQILPGSFEHTLSHLIDHEIDLSVFEARYRNDETGAPAYDPAILLKIVLFAYSKGITSSREIEALCRENVVFMALSADSTPHFTTIADFVATLGAEIREIFRDVLLVCDEAGLIGKEMFAVDGVKLPSNASKEWSGTQAEYSKKIVKMERAVEELLRRHRATDSKAESGELRAAREKLPHRTPVRQGEAHGEGQEHGLLVPHWFRRRHRDPPHSSTSPGMDAARVLKSSTRRLMRRAAGRDLVRLIARSRFRPRATDGQFAGTSRVVIRYYLN